MAFVASLPCVVSGVVGISQNVHVVSGGRGRKADAKWIVPMQMKYHEELHRIGIKSFEAKYKLNLAELAEETERKWQEYLKENQ